MRAENFLRTQKILRFATIDKDGNPHIVPVWYMYSGSRFYIGTNTKTAKARNVMGNPNVSFCIDTGIKSPEIFGVMGTGTAKLVLNETRVKSIAGKILLRYFKDLKNKSAQELLEDTDCIIEIIPKKKVSWKY